MKPHIGLTGIIGGCAATVLLGQAAIAASTAITAVGLNPTDAGLQIVLETSNGDRPQIFTVSRGNSLVADIVNTELVLPGGNGYLENDPAPGVSSVALTQLDANSVRLTITGTNEAPTGRVNQDNGLIVFTLGSAGSSASADETPPPLPSPVIENDVEVTQAPPPSNDDVLIPDPEVRIEGQRVTRQQIRPDVPPTLPRAVPPPVGDISMTSIDPSPSSIELGTQELVPRLVLRDAPVREVLALLARAAGLNLAYTGLGEDEEGETQEDVLISLDIENEPIEDVFNYVLRLSGVQASRFGRTIFAGPALPNSARDLVVQNIRLNQVDVGSALNFLVGLGAETAVSRERQVTIVDAVPISEETNITQTQTTTEERIETSRVEYQDSVPILRGLQVIGDERTNSITLVGEPRLVQIAIAQLVPLDIRRRQAVVNVRIVDVDLNAVERASTSFSFGIGNSRIVNTNGIGLINFDTESPAGVAIGADGVGDGIIGDVLGDIIQPSRAALSFGNDFLAQLQLAVTNGNGKILTDPTLVVQEGQTAEVRLTQEVITNVTVETDTDEDSSTQEVDFELEPAGVILQVQVDRIDDNGFITLSVAPTVSAPGDTQILTVLDQEVELTLIAERRLTSGQVRIRDGQTLILSGIIQEEDRVSITKVPILGDIPILGALFRRTERSNERREIIVVMTTNILNDSEYSTFGYSYNGLSPESQDLLRR